MRKILFVLVLACCLTGCEKDARAQRASSLSKVKVDVAKAEFKAADTPEKKVKVAEVYFDNAPALIGAVDDYMHGRDPGSVPAIPETMVDIKVNK
jgi:hypothetical protein